MGIAIRDIYAPMNSLGKRIKHFREAKGWSQGELAEACGWASQSRVGNYEVDKREPSLDDLRTIARLLGVTLFDLLGDSEPETNNKPATEDYELVPQYDARFAAGGGYLNGHVEMKGQLAFKKSWIAELGLNPKKIVVGYLDGLSMYPTIHDGEVILVNLAEKELISGKVYAIIRPNGGLSAKRLVKKTIGPGWIIRSDNPDKNQYPDEDATEETLHEAPILGRIRWRGGDGGL